MIKFGTSGWRGLIARDFTFNNVRLTTKGIADYLSTLSKKDGILACLLMAELVAMEGKSLGRILKDLEKKIGQFHSERINVAIQAASKEALLAKLGSGLENIGPFKVEKFVTTDGFKYLLPRSEWVAFRASGTEPLIRSYIEAKSQASLKKLRAACQTLLTT